MTTLQTSQYEVYEQITSCRLAATDNISGNYYNGPLNNGIESILSANTVGVLSIDGMKVNFGDRVVLPLQTNTYENGIYIVQDTGSSLGPWILIRSSDLQSPSQMKGGQYFTISDGATLKGSMFIITDPIPSGIGSGFTGINFANVSGGSTGQFLLKAANLSDVANRVAAVQNLGLGTGQSSTTGIGDTIVTNPVKFLYIVTPTTANEKFILPPANASNSLLVGSYFLLFNQNIDFHIDLYHQDGTTFIQTVYPQDFYQITLLDNSTANGNWFVSPYLLRINNNLSTDCIEPITNKQTCLVATTANLNATYDNGINGIGAALVNAGALGQLTIDGVTLVNGQRVLVKNQTSTLQNGIYTVFNQGNNINIPWVLERSSDYDPANDNSNIQIFAGDTVCVLSGNLNSKTMWMQTQNVTTVGTDPIVFESITNQGLQVTLKNISTNYTVTPADDGTMLVVTGSPTSTLTITLPDGTTVPKGFTVGVHQDMNDEATQVVVVPAGSNQIDYHTYATVGINGTVIFTLDASTSGGNYMSVSTSGFFQDYHRIFNINVSSYTLQQGDIGGFLYFPADGTDKTLTIPNNLALALNKGFWCEVYNPGPGLMTIATVDTIQGPLLCFPGQIMKIVKEVYGGPNVWVTSKRNGDFSRIKIPYTNSGANYVASKKDLSNTIVIDTSNTSIVLPTVGGPGTEAGYVVNIHNKTSSICFVENNFGGNYIDGLTGMYIGPFESLQLISDGVDTYRTLSRSSDFRQNLSSSGAAYADLTNSGNYFVLPANCLVQFRAEILGLDFSTSRFCSFIIEGTIGSDNTNAVAFLGTPIQTVLGRTNANYDCQAVADNTNKRLTFQVKSDVGQSLRWLARIYTTISQ